MPLHTTKRRNFEQKVSSYLALFTSSGTLLCCALPSALAAFAGGAAVASFVSTFPWLVPLSRNKEWIFLSAALMLVVTALLIYRPQGRVACRVTDGEGCEVAGRMTRVLFWTSTGIFGVGVFFAYALVPMLRLLNI